jgi:hypothetical protein
MKNCKCCNKEITEQKAKLSDFHYGCVCCSDCYRTALDELVEKKKVQLEAEVARRKEWHSHINNIKTNIK